MSHWNQASTFGIDNGELDGLSLQQCFVLGYELAEIVEVLKTGRFINRPIHAVNRARIDERCLAAGKRYRIDSIPDDQSELWLNLRVDPA